MYYCRGIIVYEKEDIADAIENLYGNFAPPIIKNIMIHKATQSENLTKYFVNISNMSSILQFIERYSIIETIVKYITSKYNDDSVYLLENAFMIPAINSIIDADEDDIDDIIDIASVQKVLYIEASSDKLLKKMEDFAGAKVNRMSISIMPYYEPYSFMEVVDKIFKIF